MASFKQHLSFSRIDELSNQLERMMEASFEPGCKGDDGNKSNKNRNLRSAHHSRNFESTIMARINNVEERLLQTSNTLEKILEIVSLTSHVRIFSEFISCSCNYSWYESMYNNDDYKCCNIAHFCSCSYTCYLLYLLIGRCVLKNIWQCYRCVPRLKAEGWDKIWDIMKIYFGVFILKLFLRCVFKLVIFRCYKN